MSKENIENTALCDGPTSHILLKYMQKREYAEDFLAGRLYMNTLGYFWNEQQLAAARKLQEERKKEQGTDEEPEPVQMPSYVSGQMDLLEGMYCYGNASTMGIAEAFSNHLQSDVFLRAKGYRYCNLFCCCQVDYQRMRTPQGPMMIHWDESQQMKEFGGYVAIILDERAFLSRINAAMTRENFLYCCGGVRYRGCRKNGKPVNVGNNILLWAENLEIDAGEPELAAEGVYAGRYDAFCKADSFAYQKEWRICLYRGVKETEPYILDLGCRLDDIVLVVRTKELVNAIGEAFRKCRICLDDLPRWYGNASRKSLRELFYKLGDYKTEVLVLFG